MQTVVRGRQREPGSLLLRPAPLVALLLLVLNDHVLKEVCPGLITNKLSDLAGAFLLPVLVLSVAELVAARRRYISSVSAATMVCFLTALGLILVKTCAATSDVYGTLVGLARYPFIHAFHRVQVATDPTDLGALLSVGLAWLYTVCGSTDGLRRRHPALMT